MLKRFFIIVAILVVIGLGGFIVYKVAYGLGETAGYDKGYPAGQSVGYSSGHDEGYTAGKEDGYTEGYSSGKADGYDEGMQAGLGHGYTLRDPTYAQAVAFIKEDKTDENEYIEDAYGVYVCTHFARDVCNNAEQKGIRCAFVEVRYPDGGHAIVAFDTIDEGLVYFDAVTDDRTSPIIGKRYYQCIEPKPGYYYEPPSFDDTIMDILVIW
jgi:hypothetical protein